MKQAAVILLFILCGCSFPKDPEDSFKKAQQEGLRVGIVDHPPYTTFEDNEAGGTEAAMIEEFAKQEGLKVQYFYGTESQLIKMLEDYKLHLMIGGFEKKTVWKDKAGQSTKYNDKNCFFVAKGENELLYRLEAYLLKHKQQHGS
jgi:polar amino acid transport system substrate-binding protein